MGDGNGNGSTHNRPQGSKSHICVPWRVSRPGRKCHPFAPTDGLRIPGIGVTKSRGSRRKQYRNWRLGVRPGPYASGLYSKMVSDLDATPPGICKAGFPEVLIILRSPGQAGYPPSAATDAQLGSSAMAYQSAEVLFDRCEGVGHIRARLLGTCAGARRGGRKGEMVRRAEAGYPCSIQTRM